MHPQLGKPAKVMDIYAFLSMVGGSQQGEMMGSTCAFRSHLARRVKQVSAATPSG
jgi:hypothetical protein